MSLVPHRFIVAFLLLSLAAGEAVALSLAPPAPLAERLKRAKLVFSGTLINRVEKDNWVRAELRVDEGILGAKKGELVKVIWPKKVGRFVIFDAAENASGVALLDHKHEGRFWLRTDKFEPMGKLAEVKKLLKAQAGDKGANAAPSYEAWVKSGKPIPPGRVFAGGSPWFNEATGQKRSPKEVYAMLYGKPEPSKAKPGAGKSRFPAHWGEPPRIQTRDLRPLPGGYGRGSSTLARWISDNMKADAKKKK